MNKSMIIPHKELGDLASTLTIMKYVFNNLAGLPETRVLYENLANAIMKDDLSVNQKSDTPSSFLDEQHRTGYLMATSYTLADYESDYKGTNSTVTQYSYVGSAVITDLLALDYWKNGKKPVDISFKTSVIRQELDIQINHIETAIQNKDRYITIHEPVRHHVEGVLKEKYAKDNKGKASSMKTDSTSSNSNIVKLGFKHVSIK